MCVSQLGKSSAAQTPKTELPKALLSAPLPLSTLLLPLLRDLRRPSDFPLAPGASSLKAAATSVLGRGS